MSEPRPGCYFCFKTLDPDDQRVEFQSFYRCNYCHTIYHQTCWHQSEKCFKCGRNDTEQIEVSPPRPLKVVIKTKSLPIKPARVIRLGDKRSSSRILLSTGAIVAFAIILWILTSFNSVYTLEVTKTTSTPVSSVATSTNNNVTRTRVTATKFVTLTSSPIVVTLCGKIYLAQPGDSISQIAGRFLNDTLDYDLIVEATSKAHAIDPTFAQLDNPNALEIGDKLCIPKKNSQPTAKTQPTTTVTKRPSTPTTPPITTPKPTATRTRRPTVTPRPTATAESKPAAALINCNERVEGEFTAFWNIHKDQLGCPKHSSPVYGQYAEMPFERGHLFWIGDIDIFGNAKQIIATFGGQNEGDKGTWGIYPDTWNGEGICGVPSPPQDLYLPDRGIAKVWCEIDGINQLGYATAPQEFVPNRGVVAMQNFEKAVLFRDSDGHSKELVYMLLWDKMTYIRERF